jgi:hypothetical protein
MQNKLAEEMVTQNERERQPQRRDARELFNAWNTEAEGEFDELDGSESWGEGETPEQGWKRARSHSITTNGTAS